MTDVASGRTFTAAPFPPFMQCIIEAGGLVPFVRRQLEEK